MSTRPSPLMSPGMPTGPPPQAASADALLRGVGVSTRKSAALLSVSWQPPLRRRAAVVLVRSPVGPAPSKLLAAAPYPTKSLILGFGKQFALHVSRVLLVTSATLAVC